MARLKSKNQEEIQGIRYRMNNQEVVSENSLKKIQEHRRENRY